MWRRGDSGLVRRPYHHHMNMACDYNVTGAGHSAMTGIMMDG